MSSITKEDAERLQQRVNGKKREVRRRVSGAAKGDKVYYPDGTTGVVVDAGHGTITVRAKVPTEPRDRGISPIRPSIPLRISSRILVAPNGCWVWIKKTNRDGYGIVYMGGGVQRLAHRVAFEAYWNVSLAGLTIDHICRVRNCCNPEHLEAVPIGVNVMRGNTIARANSLKANCPKGHPYDSANTRITKSGSRACRACENLATLVDRIARQKGYATCIREEVEPLEEEIKLIETIGRLSFKPGRRLYELVAELAASRGDALARIDEAEAENVKLRALAQTLVDALGTCETFGGKTWSEATYDEVAVSNGLSAAASQGFTPTNTTEG